MPKYKHPLRLRMNGLGFTSRDMVHILHKEYGWDVSDKDLSLIFSGALRNDRAERTLGYIEKYMNSLKH